VGRLGGGAAPVQGQHLLDERYHAVVAGDVAGVGEPTADSPECATALSLL
jgi:hypothetical protein